MTREAEQERPPRTEAGRAFVAIATSHGTGLGHLPDPLPVIVARIEEQARTEGRQQAVRYEKVLRRLVKAAEMARRNLQGTTPCYCASSPHEDYCGDLIHAVSAANLLLLEGGVAGLNASESPPEFVYDPGSPHAETCQELALYRGEPCICMVGDASESPPTEPHRDYAGRTCTTGLLHSHEGDASDSTDTPRHRSIITDDRGWPSDPRLAGWGEARQSSQPKHKGHDEGRYHPECLACQSVEPVERGGHHRHEWQGSTADGWETCSCSAIRQRRP